MEPVDYQRVSKIIFQGGIIAYPTEGVWGIGCDPWNESAVNKILSIKQRSADKGLILVVADTSQIAQLLAPLSEEMLKRINTVYERATTWLIPDNNGWAPDFVRGKHSSVAVRISQHPVVKSICNACDKPVISTSANVAGEPPLTTFTEVSSCFSEKLDMIVPGKTCGAGLPSRIIDLKTGIILR